MILSGCCSRRWFSTLEPPCRKAMVNQGRLLAAAEAARSASCQFSVFPWYLLRRYTARAFIVRSIAKRTMIAAAAMARNSS